MVPKNPSKSKPCVTFLTRFFFYGELLAPRTILKLEDYHFSAVPYYLFAGTLRI
jgi:hypothetical protein